MPAPFPHKRSRLPATLVMLAVTAGVPGSAGAVGTPGDPSDICIGAANEAARVSGVPVEVLLAISLTETGRARAGETRPWPWTVNMEGDGHWFESEDDARAYVYREYKRGARSFDVGCFQINYRWHGEHFASIDEMFDPLANALYAARFLAQLYGESGDWSVAAGTYHSRTPLHAERYRGRFDRFLAGLSDGADLPLANPGDSTPAPALAGSVPEIPDIVLARDGSDDPAPAVRVNTFPLLRTGTAGVLGSLVPLSATPAAGNGPEG